MALITAVMHTVALMIQLNLENRGACAPAAPQSEHNRRTRADNQAEWRNGQKSAPNHLHGQPFGDQGRLVLAFDFDGQFMLQKPPAAALVVGRQQSKPPADP